MTSVSQSDEIRVALDLPIELGKLSDTGEFFGIASDETPDTEGDQVLRDTLDLSYAQTRGYVNWDHSREPEAQIGYLTRCEIVTPENREEFSAKVGYDIPKTATVFVQGQLYVDMPKAQAVSRIMEVRKLYPEAPPLGMSLDGSTVFHPATGLVKNFVRGVALTQAPAHLGTVAALRKSIDAVKQLNREDVIELIKKISAEAVKESRLEKSKEEISSRDRIVIQVLRMRPNWSYMMAASFVHHQMRK